MNRPSHIWLVIGCLLLPNAPLDAFAQAQNKTEEKMDDNVVTTRSAVVDPLAPPRRTRSVVSKEQIIQRQARSAPDALRYEPGVFVQQTAHSQGSAYIRGLTGQRTILLFDGIRLNNSLFRQGPNQYFFTIDSRSIDQLIITRGSASTYFGSDAISGAINTIPLRASTDAPTNITDKLAIHPGLQLFGATADTSWGGRLHSKMAWNKSISLLVGVGGRKVNQLESSGPIFSPVTKEPPQIPRFESDGRTQVGTGFDELTADAHAIVVLDRSKSLSLAHYTYRQYNAPRTDQCPPAFAPFDECLTYDEQFRSLTYGKLQGNWGWWANASTLSISHQTQHEKRRLDRPGAQALNQGEDDLSSYGLSWKARTKAWTPLNLHLMYGGDVWQDRVTSTASTTLLNLGQTFEGTRGLYLSGSTYAMRGVWSEAHVRLFGALNLRLGGRLSHIQASAPEDPESGTQGVSQRWTPAVGNAGLEWWVNSWLTLQLNQDGAFRAPNLDDLTSRQRTGPGFQLENANLLPERGYTTEVSARVSPYDYGVELQAWLYRTVLSEAIVRTSRDVDACPPNTPECRTTASRLQLVNLPDNAQILGAEAGLKLTLPWHITLASNISFATGEGPAPPVKARIRDAQAQPHVPLSRIPPLNGTAELLWRNATANGPYLGAALRWARTQDRLSLGDQSDERIPLGGTPGFAVFDLRGGWRLDDTTGVYVVFENLFDSAYRYHGSSVNGPARGASVEIQLGL